MRFGKIFLIVFVALFGIASIGLAGSEKVKKSVDDTIREQTIQTEQLKQRIENIQKLTKPIQIPAGVRLKKK